MKKKIILSVGIIILSWFLFIWIKYHFFVKNYDTEHLKKEFISSEIPPPVYDSIDFRGYKINYLTNKKNVNADHDALTGNSKPYLFLIHDSGDNSGSFIEYFKNKKINELFHIIAVDRVGFGSTVFRKPSDAKDSFSNPEMEEFGEKTDFINAYAVHEILNNEGHHLEEVRIVSTNSSGLLGIKAFSWEPLSSTKVFMFYPEITERSIISRSFSKFFSNKIIASFFPKTFVSKQKDLLVLDEIKKEEYLETAKYLEDKNSQGIDKGMRSVFFILSDKAQEKSIRDSISSNNFIYEIKSKMNIYKNPDFVNEIILENDSYTHSFNRIKNNSMSSDTISHK